jgi:DNA-directed RNA polymerase subunit RPC12/RpoP
MKIIEQGIDPVKKRQDELRNNCGFNGKIYKCANCGTKFVFEPTDYDNIIHKTNPNWYEWNIPRSETEDYLKCECCGRNVPLLTFEEGNWYSYTTVAHFLKDEFGKPEKLIESD